MIWTPQVTVAAVIEHKGRFLMVQEQVSGQSVYNQPAGHLTLFVMLLMPAFLLADAFSKDIIMTPEPELFSVCFDHSCTTVVTDSLTREEWRQATAPLQQAAATAPGERAAIARSIAILEEIVGQHNGTYRDKGRNLRGFGQPAQLDCIDESTNTNTYLHMLERDGRFKYHKVVERVTRFGLFVGMPHTTAVIQENESRTRYVVDSWFFDNGQPPYIEQLELWKSGGEPDDS